MSQRWTGIRIIFYMGIVVMMGCLMAGMFIYAIWHTVTVDGWPDNRGIIAFYAAGALTIIGLMVYTMWVSAPTTVVLNDRGVMWRRAGRERFVEWDDVATIDSSWPDSPGAGAPAIYIHPTSEYFESRGLKEPRAMGKDWAIVTLGFSRAELAEMATAFKHYMKQAHGRSHPSVHLPSGDD